jgi:hypothetical protein
MAILVVESLRTRHCRKARVIAVGKIDGELRLIYRNLRKITRAEVANVTSGASIRCDFGGSKPIQNMRQ